MFCCFPCCDAHTFGSWSSSHLLLLPHWSAHIPLTAHIPLFLSPPPTFPSPLSVLSLHLALHSLLFFILFPYSTPLFHLFHHLLHSSAKHPPHRYLSIYHLPGFAHPPLSFPAFYPPLSLQKGPDPNHCLLLPIVHCNRVRYYHCMWLNGQGDSEGSGRVGSG